MTDFYKWMEESRKQQGELVAIFEKQFEYIVNANKRIRELEAENAGLNERIKAADRAIADLLRERKEDLE